MPRSNREYLLRYADQALDSLDRALEYMKRLSDAYGGVYAPLDGDVLPVLRDVPEEYEGQHGKYQKYVDLVAFQVIEARKELEKFRKQYM